MAVRDGVVAWLGSDAVGQAQFPDARIVDLIARKRYPHEGAGALPSPGVVVHVFAASSHEADVFELDASQPAQLQLAG